jgi:hypothetical protein
MDSNIWSYNPWYPHPHTPHSTTSHPKKTDDNNTATWHPFQFQLPWLKKHNYLTNTSKPTNSVNFIFRLKGRKFIFLILKNKTSKQTPSPHPLPHTHVVVFVFIYLPPCFAITLHQMSTSLHSSRLCWQWHYHTVLSTHNNMCSKFR